MHARISALAALGICLLLALLPAAPAGAASEALPQRTMTVSGEGEAKAAPDEAHLSVGVVTQAARAADALAANSRAMSRTFATLKQLGIPEKAMQTSEFSVSPQYPVDRSGNQQKITGYQVSNTVSVTIDELAKLGPALDALVSSGANSLGGVSFTIRDPKPAEAQARIAAVHDAMERAQTYAKAAGLQLGRILSISEGYERPQTVMHMAMAAAPAATPIAAGEDTISATVSVTFEIR